MARMAARKGTGTKDWYAKFTRDGKSAGKLGPYVTRRAALEDAKVVLRAKVRGLVDEAGEPVRVLRVRDANNNEAGYEASDGSISVITASSGKATFNERVNPRRRNPTVTGREAIEAALKGHGTLRKDADFSTWSFSRPVTVQEAMAIVQVDPRLIYLVPHETAR